MKRPEDSSHEQDTLENRRGCARYTADADSVVVLVGDRAIKGRLLDQSIGGVAIASDNTHGLTFGKKVSVDVGGSNATGYIRSIRREADDAFRISISWNDYARADANCRRSIANYLSYRDVLLICDLLYDDVDGTKTVRLWDGAEFCVSPAELCSRSVETRRSELMANTSDLSMLVHLYELSPNGTEEEVIEEVLDFEFTFESREAQDDSQTQDS